MHNRIKSLEVLFSRDREDLFVTQGSRLNLRAEIAAGKQIGVQTDHFVAGRAHDGASYSADISFMAS